MSDRLNAILEKLGDLPRMEAFGDTIEAIRAAYDVDHVHYVAISLGLEARSRADRQIAELPEAHGVLLKQGRQLAAWACASCATPCAGGRCCRSTSRPLLAAAHLGVDCRTRTPL